VNDPGAWTDEFGDEVVDLITEAVELGDVYTYEACTDEILDLSAEQTKHMWLGQFDSPAQYGTGGS